MSQPLPESIAQQIADRFAVLPQVVATALSGSRTAALPDARSDLDLYVYSREHVPVADRIAIAHEFGDVMRLDNHFWEDGDEWDIRGTTLSADLTFRSPQWIEEQLDRLLVQKQASVGYSTCFWFNVQHSRALYDRDGWFAALQAQANQPYTEALQHAVLAKNYPVLRALPHSSYLHQLDSAVARGDLVSIQHRSAALLASYFDILFAVNRESMPGEKRLIQYAQQLAKIPDHMAEDVNAFIVAIGTPEQVIPMANRLLDRLDALLMRESLDEINLTP